MSVRVPGLLARAGFALALIAASSACGAGGEVRVFAASSLQDSLPLVLDRYGAEHAGTAVVAHFSGSQVLATQIEEGAHADLFISANLQQADRLADRGLVVARETLLTNRLVVAVPADSPLRSVGDLADGGVRIAIGTPEVPVGALTRRALEGLGEDVREGVLANVVTRDPSVRVVLSRVVLGEADAGFVYRTDLGAAPDLRAIELPDEAGDVRTRYIVARLRGAAAGAEDLMRFLLGPEAQRIFAEAGFEPAGQVAEVGS